MLLKSTTLTHAALWLLSLSTLGLSAVTPRSAPSTVAPLTTASGPGTPPTNSEACRAGQGGLMARGLSVGECSGYGRPRGPRTLSAPTQWGLKVKQAPKIRDPSKRPKAYPTSQNGQAGVELTAVSEPAGLRLTVRVTPGRLMGIPRGKKATALRNIRFTVPGLPDPEARGRPISATAPPPPAQVFHAMADIPLGSGGEREKTDLVERAKWEADTNGRVDDAGYLVIVISYVLESR